MAGSSYLVDYDEANNYLHQANATLQEMETDNRQARNLFNDLSGDRVWQGSPSHQRALQLFNDLDLQYQQLHTAHGEMTEAVQRIMQNYSATEDETTRLWQQAHNV
ncbi:hypothetical protein [Kitasatospora sp. NPDC093102]|uniref:hypothetical protein n=1 Tax=Kitasatospora sp. NPDC093102 TaxID=3155069 RepID=UPI003449E100